MLSPGWPTFTTTVPAPVTVSTLTATVAGPLTTVYTGVNPELATAPSVNGGLPTAWLSGLGSPWNTVQPEGQIRLQSENWAWRQEGQQVHTSGQFIVTLEQFATRLSSLKPLGDYQLAFIGAADTRIRLTTLAGALQMEGQGVWRRGHLQFVGEAWAREAQDESALSNLLGVIGPRNGARALLRVG